MEFKVGQILTVRDEEYNVVYDTEITCEQDGILLIDTCEQAQKNYGLTKWNLIYQLHEKAIAVLNKKN